jgi:hypothetical protein
MKGMTNFYYHKFVADVLLEICKVFGVFFIKHWLQKVSKKNTTFPHCKIAVAKRWF